MNGTFLKLALFLELTATIFLKRSHGFSKLLPALAMGDWKSGRLLGAQMVGHSHGEVAKRTDVFATALFQGMLIDDLNHLDLSYTSPLSNPWDPIQTSAQAWVRAQGSTHDVVRTL